jgi:DNA-nicking Smr family endonuclease
MTKKLHHKMKKTDKHGFSVLTDKDDLFEVFTGEKAEEHPDETFSEMIESSLVEKDLQQLLQGKKEKAPPSERITTGELIKAYPPPEEEIDLHGYTAKGAETEIESFLQLCRTKGVRTLRIIGGKGLHSKGRAVLPDIIENKVVDLKKRGSVLTFKWEKNSKLKSGAMIVYLTIDNRPQTIGCGS